MNILTRKDALAGGLKRYFTGKACQQGHVSERLVCNRKCVLCNRAYSSKLFWESSEHRAKILHRFATLKTSLKAKGWSRSGWHRITPEIRSRNSKAAYRRDPFRTLMRVMVRRVFTGRKAKSCEAILGYSVEQLRARLQCQFKAGMSFSNYGEWHIDHKKPVNAFRSLDPKTVNMLCNLQPLWAADNVAKSDKWHGNRVA